jgi:hypothetical protein
MICNPSGELTIDVLVDAGSEIPEDILEEILCSVDKAVYDAQTDEEKRAMFLRLRGEGSQIGEVPWQTV